MRDFLKGMAAVILALAIFPLGAVLFDLLKGDEAVPVTAPPPEEPKVYEYITDVVILDTVKGTTFTLSTEDYILAAINANEFPDAEDELIKAQAVIFYTYILSRRVEESYSPTPSLMGADISTDSSRYLPLRLPTGEDAERITRLRELISEVLGRYIAFESEPISPAFCYSSGGDTQSAKTVYGEDIPYLRSVSSSYDSGFTTVTAYTKAEVFARLSTAGKGYDLYTEPEKWIAVSQANPDGYITEVLLDGRYYLTGRELAGILNLPSAKFTVTYNAANEIFSFTSKGQGHLVGLSLYGANEMAKTGNDWQEILYHYYTDVDIT